jgi:hypothetical protein
MPKLSQFDSTNNKVNSNTIPTFGFWECKCYNATICIGGGGLGKTTTTNPWLLNLLNLSSWRFFEEHNKSWMDYNFYDQYCVVCARDLFHTCEVDKIFCTKLGAKVECLCAEIECLGVKIGCQSAEVISAWLEVTPKLWWVKPNHVQTLPFAKHTHYMARISRNLNQAIKTWLKFWMLEVGVWNPLSWKVEIILKT